MVVIELGAVKELRPIKTKIFENPMLNVNTVSNIQPDLRN